MYFLLAQTAGYAVSLLFSWYYSRNGVSLQTEVPSSVGFSLLSSMRWFALLSLCMAVFTRVDTQMLRYLSPDGDAEVGQYARSFRFLDAALIFSSLISSQLLPLFSRMISRQEPTDGLMWLNVRIVLFVALPLLFSGIFFASPLLAFVLRRTRQGGLYSSGYGYFWQTDVMFFAHGAGACIWHLDYGCR